jgi:hypothetical protein
MSKSLLLSLVFVLATPAFAKPYPLSCSDLWGTVTDVLGNQGNYKIVTTDQENMKASFIVVGALFPGVNALNLKPKDNGCELKIQMGFTVCFRQACVVEDTWFISWGLCRDDERVRASG